MHKNGAMLTVACVMLCLTFNYTFPLRRESSKWNIFGNRNDSQLYCNKKHHLDIVDPINKMAAHTENALKIIKDSNHKENQKKKKQAKCPAVKTTDDDIRHFEQMVIRKKNPYLDLKEFELKYYNPKNTRQSVDPGPIGQDPSMCEHSEDGPNVEITNRGLSGFVIPKKLLKESINIAENKIKIESPNNGEIAKVSKKETGRQSRNLELLNTLEDDIRRYEGNKNEDKYL